MREKKPEAIKGAIRASEGMVEVFLLALAYYFVWRQGYDEGIFRHITVVENTSLWAFTLY